LPSPPAALLLESFGRARWRAISIQTTTPTTTSTNRYFIVTASSTALAAEQNFQHESRTDIGQQQECGAHIQPPRGTFAAPAVQVATNQERGEHAQARIENTALWSAQRHCTVLAMPSSSVAVNTTKPASTKRKVTRSSCSSGIPRGAVGACTGVLPGRRRRSAASSSNACSTAAPNKP
jgi:hypothetical protein